MTHKQPPMRKKSSDLFQTPSIAIGCLVPYLKKGSIIWEPAEGKGNISRFLRERESLKL